MEMETIVLREEHKAELINMLENILANVRSGDAVGIFAAVTMKERNSSPASAGVYVPDAIMVLQQYLFEMLGNNCRIAPLLPGQVAYEQKEEPGKCA